MKNEIIKKENEELLDLYPGMWAEDELYESAINFDGDYSYNHIPDLQDMIDIYGFRNINRISAHTNINNMISYIINICNDIKHAYDTGEAKKCDEIIGHFIVDDNNYTIVIIGADIIYDDDDDYTRIDPWDPDDEFKKYNITIYNNTTSENNRYRARDLGGIITCILDNIYTID